MLQFASVLTFVLCLPSYANNTEEHKTRFSASLDGAFGFSTNPYFAPMSDIQGGGSFLFNLKPSIELEGAAAIGRLGAKLKGNAATFLGASQQARFVLSDAEFASNGVLFPNGIASMFFDTTIQTSRHVAKIFVDSLTELKGDLYVGALVRPSGGVITIYADAEAKAQSFFDVNQPTAGKYTDDPSKLFNNSYYARLKLGWEFAPDLEVFVNAKYGTWRCPAVSDVVALNPLFIDVGVSGDITPQVHGTLSVGYANNYIRLVQTKTPLDGASLAFSMLAKLDWHTSKYGHLHLKFARDLEPTPLFLETFTSAFEASYAHQWWDEWNLAVSPYLRLYEYGKPLAADGSGRLAGSHRIDLALGFKEEVSYRMNEWLSLGFEHHGLVRWTNASDFQIFTDAGKLADGSGNFAAWMSSNTFAVFGRLVY